LPISSSLPRAPVRVLKISPFYSHPLAGHECVMELERAMKPLGDLGQKKQNDEKRYERPKVKPKPRAREYGAKNRKASVVHRILKLGANRAATARLVPNAL
jgi:hypothetical protein